MSEHTGGTVTYHRADYRPGTDEPWLVWFTEDQADPYWFTAEQGEAMGLTPPEPAPLVVTCNGHSIELSDEQVGEYVDLWADQEVSSLTGGRVAVSIALANLLRDARQDPQPASDEPTYFPDEGFTLVKRNVRTVTANVVQPAPATSDDIDFDALPDGTVLLRTDGRSGVRIKVEGVWTFDGLNIAAPLLPKNWRVHQPPTLSPGECLRGLLAGRDDADELIEYAARHWNYANQHDAVCIVLGTVGDAAREVHG